MPVDLPLVTKIILHKRKKKALNASLMRAYRLLFFTTGPTRNQLKSYGIL